MEVSTITTLCIPVLLAVSTRRLQYSLQVLLASVPELDVAQAPAEANVVLEWIKQNPDGVLVLNTDSTSPENLTLLKAIKEKYPRASCILIAENFNQVSTAIHMGVDAALLSGFQVDEWFSIIRKILKEREGNKL